jgi:hypothetical protein
LSQFRSFKYRYPRLYRAVYTKQGVFRISWRALIAWLWIRTAVWTEISGFKISVFPTVGNDDAEAARGKVIDALEQLMMFDFRRYGQCEHYMPWIMIRPARRSHYDIDAGICMLDLADALLGSPAGIAAVLVHEATHARLSFRGIRYVPRLQARIENICVAEELAFVNRLPDQDYPGKERWVKRLVTYLRHGHTPELLHAWDNWDERRAQLLNSRGK